MSHIEEKFNSLFQEWETYHFAYIKFRSSSLDKSLDHIIAHDVLKQEANKLYRAYMSGKLNKRLINNFENKLTDYRSKTTFNILTDGKIR